MSPNDSFNLVKLQTAKQGEIGIFECQPDERLLYAGLRAGLPLPYECATGTCGSCKAQVVGGEVVSAWAEAPGFRHVKPAKGEILLCQSYAVSDCSISVSPGPKVELDAAILPAHFTARVRRSGMLTHDVLIMEIALDRPMNFEAGQFVLLAASLVEGYRAYSMVNQAGWTDTLELIVKRKPGGTLTKYLFDQDLAGPEFRVMGPLGRATFDANKHQGGDLVCAAGGTGIAGLMSVLAEASDSGYLERHRAVVFFGVRRADDLFFLDRFATLCRRHPDSLRVIIAISDEELLTHHSREHPSLRFERGQVHEALAATDLSEFSNVTSFVAGPVPAVEALTSILLVKHRFAPSRIRFDRFG